MEWRNNLAARHRKRAKASEECVDRPLTQILEIMKGRKGSLTTADQGAAPKLMHTPSGQLALYHGNKSKWCPPGKWTLHLCQSDTELLLLKLL